RTADCMIHLGLFDEAEKILSEILSHSWDRYAVYGMARIQRSTNRTEMAIQNYKALLIEDPSDIRTIINFAELLAATEGYERAMAFLEGKRHELHGLRDLEPAIKRFSSNQLGAQA
ncbi:MAG TPA: hypothetical protein PLD82_07730, partial [Spirochaetota bacterium]|nr:hypothetical protein [Spirochaetota bacterium]